MNYYKIILYIFCNSDGVGPIYVVGKLYTIMAKSQIAEKLPEVQNYQLVKYPHLMI